MKEKIIFTNLVGTALDDIIASLDTPQVVVVADTNTAQYVLPVLTADSKTVAKAHVITVPAAGRAQGHTPHRRGESRRRRGERHERFCGRVI